MRNVGTVVRGIRTPIIKENDDLANIVVESLLRAKESENFVCVRFSGLDPEVFNCFSQLLIP